MNPNNNASREEAKATSASQQLIAGIDLHSNNLMIGLIDQTGKRLKHRKLSCDLNQVLQFLAPFKDSLRSIAVESTFNWYWLVDGLHEEGYQVVLANPAAIEQYNGIKHVDDKTDAFFLAELQRLKILPIGYIYDPALRPVRDLLRRRLSLVRQRTSLLLSAKNLHLRTTGQPLNSNRLKTMEPGEASNLYEHAADRLVARVQMEHILALGQSIDLIEKEVLQTARGLPGYSALQTLPGIGRVLSLTIAMEVGEISRFRDPGQFASYCRTVNSKRLSNGKKKGENNAKCGNKYLAWALVEAANFAKRFDSDCRRWFDRKAAATSKIIATKALACKLAKAVWHVMSTGDAYNPQRMFARLATNREATD
jgi:transposase